MDEILPTTRRVFLFRPPPHPLSATCINLAMYIHEFEGPSKLFNNSVRPGKKLSHGKLGLPDRAFAMVRRPLVSLVEHRAGEYTEKGEEKRGEFERVDVGQEAKAYRGNSGARNESSAVENPDRNQSDSICIMEKARDNVCTGLPARATFLSRLSFSLSPPRAVESYLSLLSLTPLLSSVLETGGLTVDWFGVRVEPKSLLMGSFGFDHRLTFPIHRWYISLARPRFISSSYPPRSNLYSIESLLSSLLSHRLRRGEWNKERWNESLGKRQRKVRRSLKTLSGKLIRRICPDCIEAQTMKGK